MTYKVRVTLKGGEDRPSGHKLSPGFSAGGLAHEETIGCAHAREHGLLFLKFLDASAYDCGVRQGEFQDIEGWAPRFRELVELLEKMARTKGIYTKPEGVRPMTSIKEETAK